MSLFDKIKDVLTTDDEERAAKARELADEAQQKADELKKAASAAAEKAGIDTPEAQDAAKAADEAAAEAKAVQDLHNEHIAAEAEADDSVQATYTVKKGDTLSAIGAEFGVSYQDIAKLNHIKNPDLIYPGQVFKIPAK